MPVIAPALKASSRPPASEVVAACAVRTLARTETFMPIKPAAPESTAPRTKPTGASQFLKKKAMAMVTTTPTQAMVVYWRFR